MPTSIEFVDIAGLVKGASTGEGLGNKFLANIRECDSIVQVSTQSSALQFGEYINSLVLVEASDTDYFAQ